MPLEAYYKQKGLPRDRANLHKAIFKTLLTEGRPIAKTELEQRVLEDVHPTQGRTKLPELSQVQNPRRVVENEIAQLHELGFLERVGLNRLRITPAVAIHLAK